MSNSVFIKFGEVAKKVLLDKKEVTFFALFLRVDLLNTEGIEKYDLIISAPWIDEDDTKEISEYIFGILIRELGAEILANFFQKLELFNSNTSFIRALTREAGSVSDMQIRENIDGIKKAYVYLSNPED